MTSGLEPARPPAPLREQRRAELRQRLSDTATAMFLDRGFDAVTVADVARACGVTEKTVFNHFGSKESLMVDRWDEITATVRANLTDSSSTVLAAVVATLHAELDYLTQSGKAGPEHMSAVIRFGALLASTPSLQDHRRRSQHQLTAAMLAALAERWGIPQHDARAQIAAEALSGMFVLFYRSLARHAPTQNSAMCRRAVRDDVQRAANTLASGIDA